MPPKPDFGQPPAGAGAPALNGAVGIPNGIPKPPRINSDYPVTYWADTQIGLSGLKNLGNTCYMNAPIQCLSATVPFSRFFTGELFFLCGWSLVSRGIDNIHAGFGRESLEECHQLHKPVGFKGTPDRCLCQVVA